MGWLSWLFGKRKEPDPVEQEVPRDADPLLAKAAHDSLETTAAPKCHFCGVASESGWLCPVCHAQWLSDPRRHLHPNRWDHRMAPTTAPSEFRTYRQEEALTEIAGINPLPESWDSKDSPAQQRIADYLDGLRRVLVPAIDGKSDLFLHLDIRMDEAKTWWNACDLDNYLHPLFSAACLDQSRFVLVSAA